MTTAPDGASSPAAEPLDASPLGRATPRPDHYDPGLLFPLSRRAQRQALGLHDDLPFIGADVWTAYELSWLNGRGKPQIALADLTVPCDSPNLIESKSLKLYLNSHADERYADPSVLRDRLRADLAEALWRGSERSGTVGVRLHLPEAFGQIGIAPLEGLRLDRLDLECEASAPAPELLRADDSQAPVEEALVSDLFRSLCPVTGQPDWASVRIAYRGPLIDQAGLLRYLVSFRQHADFHEHCVERIFMDLWQRCRPLRLSVQARFTRRGGLDINPWRSSHPQVVPPNVRTARQ